MGMSMELSREQVEVLEQGGFTFSALTVEGFLNVAELKRDVSELTDDMLLEFLTAANLLYRGGVPLVTDDIYDFTFLAELKNRSPDHPFLKEVGSPIIKDKVKLPFYMPSLDKIKPDTDLLDKWENKFTGPYVLSDKLDGVSGLIYKNADGAIKM